MHVQVEIAVEVASQAKATRARPHIGHGGLRRLLHDIAELPRQGELAFAVDYASFGAQDRTADLGPGQTSNQANFGLFMRQRVPELDHAKEVIDVLGRDRDREVLAFLHDFACHLPADVSDFALEIAYASFTRVRAD